MAKTHPMGKWVSQFRKGVIELVVLNLLSHGESYGYELTQRCSGIPGLEIKEATLYQVLTRLCQEGILKTRRERTNKLRKRTYFSLTVAGRKRVDEMNEHFDYIATQVQQLRLHGESS